MKCPNCGNEISDSLLVCPLCKSNINFNNANQRIVRINTQVVPTKVVVPTVDKDVENNKKGRHLFFKATIIIGLFIFCILLIKLLIPSNSNEDDVTKTTTTTVNSINSLNIGTRSTYSFPVSIGRTTLATLYDKKNDKYTDVDVSGVRYIVNEELNDLIINYASMEPLIEGFYWYGFEYNVKLNDLTYLKDNSISPLLDATIYQLNGNDFFLVGEHYYKIKVTSIYTGVDIKNGETASVKIIFQVPFEQDFSICLGLRNKTMGCFKRG